MITHGNVCHYAHALAQALGIHSDDRYLQPHRSRFPLRSGSSLCPSPAAPPWSIASTDELRDPQILFETIRRQNISVLDFVPSFSAGCLQVLMSLEPSARAGAARKSCAADAFRERAAARLR